MDHAFFQCDGCDDYCEKGFEDLKLHKAIIHGCNLEMERRKEVVCTLCQLNGDIPSIAKHLLTSHPLEVEILPLQNLINFAMMELTDEDFNVRTNSFDEYRCRVDVKRYKSESVGKQVLYDRGPRLVERWILYSKH